MKTIEQFVPVRYVAQLIDHLESTGTRCRAMLDADHRRALDNAEGGIATGQFEALVADLEQITARHDLGIELGKLIKLNSHDVLGHAMISCATIDHSLHVLARYFRLVTPMFTMRYVRHAHETELLVQPTLAMHHNTMRFYLDAIGVSHLVLITRGAESRLRRCSVYSALPAPAHVERFREFHPARFLFGQEQSASLRIVLESSVLDAKLAMSNLRALELAEARCKELLQQVTDAGRWSDRVAMMLREAEDCQPTLDELARSLNISGRTLDRYLEKENVSFRGLTLSIRNERACALLADGKYSVSQIAYRLGYTDIANFSRSFKRINGLSPSAFADRTMLA